MSLAFAALLGVLLIAAALDSPRKQRTRGYTDDTERFRSLRNRSH